MTLMTNEDKEVMPMAKSRRESPLREAKGNSKAWPGQEAVLDVVRGFSLVHEHKKGSLK